MHKISSIAFILLAGLTTLQAQSVKQLIDTARAYKFRDPDKAQDILKKVFLKLNTKPDIQNEIQAANVFGITWWAKGDFKKADSLLHISMSKAAKAGNDTMLIILNNNLGLIHRDFDTRPITLTYHKHALAVAKKINRLYDVADTYNNMGSVYMYYNMNDSAIFFYEKGLVVYQSNMVNDKDAEIGFGDIATNIGSAYFAEGKYTLGYTYFFKALKVFEKYRLYDKATIAANNIGEIYFDKQELEKALSYCKLSLSYEKKSPNGFQKAYNMFTIGKIYDLKGQKDSSLIYLELAADIFRKYGVERNLADVLNSIAAVNFNLNNFEKGFKVVEEAIAINKKLQDTSSLCSSYSNIASVYIRQEKYTEAEKMTDLCIQMMKPEMNFSMYCDIYEQAALVKAKLGKYKIAYEYLAHFNIYRDSLRNENNQRQQEEIASMYQLDKKEQQLKLAKTENEKNTLALQHSEEEGKRKSLQLYAALGGGLLMLVLIAFMIRSNLARKRSNKLLAEKNRVIYEQKKEVEMKQQEIIDSIKYASRIQKALFPNEKQIDNSFKKLRERNKTGF